MSKKKDNEVVTKKELHDIKYQFTKEEIDLKSKQLAVACEDRSRLEDEKKEIMSNFKYKLDGKNSEINLLSNHINTGFEHKNVTCEVQMDYKAGVKKYYWEGKLYDTIKMTASDYQMEISE